MDVPEVVVLRLPQYVRTLTQLQSEGIEVVSSQLLGRRLQMTPAQIRKDLSYFGRFGKQGQGYRVANLVKELHQILGLDKQWKAVLVGVGRLGRSIISYPGFAPEGFHIVAAFDSNPAMVGQNIEGLVIQDISDLETMVRRANIRLAIVAVPASSAQAVVDQLVKLNVSAILSYAPITPKVPDGVKVRTLDPVFALQTMTFYLVQPSESVR